MNIVPWINIVSKEHDEIEKHKAELGLVMREAFIRYENHPTSKQKMRFLTEDTIIKYKSAVEKFLYSTENRSPEVISFMTAPSRFWFCAYTYFCTMALTHIVSPITERTSEDKTLLSLFDDFTQELHDLVVASQYNDDVLIATFNDFNGFIGNNDGELTAYLDAYAPALMNNGHQLVGLLYSHFKMRDELPTLKLFPDINHPHMLLGQWNNNKLVKYYLVE